MHLPLKDQMMVILHIRIVLKPWGGYQGIASWMSYKLSLYPVISVHGLRTFAS